MSRGRYPPALAAALVAAVALAGCLEPAATEGPLDEPVPANPSDAPRAANATLDERPPSAGLKETNRTEDGLGGREHRHDYWKGRSSVLLVDERVRLSPFPVFPDGAGTAARSEAYLKLPPPALVYEGASHVEVLATAPALGGPAAGAGVAPPHVAPAALALQWRTAASSAWSEPVPLALDEPLVIPVAPLEADMPHSVASLWAFRLTSDRSDDQSVQVTVTAVKGRDVAEWPGHPDFYAEGDARVILDADATTVARPAVERYYLYGGGASWAVPEYLVGHGTTRLEVFANVTRFSSAAPVQPAGYVLEVHDATELGNEPKNWHQMKDGDGTNDLVSYNFTVPVSPEGMDGPYQPESRWGLRLVATLAAAGAPGVVDAQACSGCFPYEVEYHITVIAVRE